MRIYCLESDHTIQNKNVLTNFSPRKTGRSKAVLNIIYKCNHQLSLHKNYNTTKYDKTYVLLRYIEVHVHSKAWKIEDSCFHKETYMNYDLLQYK
jgi:hypothetical protein